MNNRFHLPRAARGPRRPHLFLPARPTPLFPSPPLSPLSPAIYSHTYTTATPQPLYHQSLTYLFHRDGGCTPLSHFGSHLSPIRQELAPVFSCTSRDPFCNPFVFKFIQEWDGGTPLLKISTLYPPVVPSGAEGFSVRPLPTVHYSLPTILMLCSLPARRPS